MNLSDHFHCYVITLKGWEERLQRFHDRAAELGVTGIRVIQGVDGKLCHPPPSWKHSKAKWGCNSSHSHAIFKGTHGDKPILIFEDDAFLRDDFVEKIQEAHRFMSKPRKTVLYLGGKTRIPSTNRVTPSIVSPIGAVGAYAYIVSQEYAPKLLGYIMDGLNDVQMKIHGVEDEHAIFLPVCVGHDGGPSTLRRRDRKDQHCGPLPAADPYSTHLPILKKHARGSAVEFGCGLNSTPVLLEMCDTVMSVEMQDAAWLAKVRDHLGESPAWDAVDAVGAFNFLGVPYPEEIDVALVDGHGGSRSACVNFMMRLKVPVIIAHDTECARYRWDLVVPEGYTAVVHKELTPWTTVWTRD